MKSTHTILLALIILFSCTKSSNIKQIDSDLRNMLENKVEIKNLYIERTSPFIVNGKKYDSIYFNCEVLFIEDLFSTDLKFDKGMRISAEHNVFIYDNSSIPQLVKLKFGNTRLISQE